MSSFLKDLSTVAVKMLDIENKNIALVKATENCKHVINQFEKVLRQMNDAVGRLMKDRDSSRDEHLKTQEVLRKTKAELEVTRDNERVAFGAVMELYDALQMVSIMVGEPGIDGLHINGDGTLDFAPIYSAVASLLMTFNDSKFADLQARLSEAECRLQAEARKKRLEVTW